MKKHTRRLLAAGLLLSPALAWAQPAAAPPAWQQGRPAEMSGSTLAPHAPRLTVTAPAAVPVTSLRVPEGFRVELWASGMPGIRQMALGPNGTVFGGTRVIGRVYAVRDQGGSRTVSTLMQGLTQPSGVAVRDGALYIAAMHQMLRIDNVESNLANPQPVDLTAAFNQTTDAHHGWKHIEFGPDGRLYINRGVPCNICDTDGERFALIESWRPDGTDRRIEARGVRNSVGFDFHPRTGQLWFTNHGRDWAGNDNPSDALHVNLRRGEHHGYPWCAAGFQDPAVSGRLCSEFPPPALILGPHVAPVGTHFYTGTAFPPQYRGAMFIPLAGSWNREQQSGFEVITVREGEGGRLIREPFMTGFQEPNNRFNGRPSGALTMPDGSLLISDQQNGAIYRITYTR